MACADIPCLVYKEPEMIVVYKFASKEQRDFTHFELTSKYNFRMFKATKMNNKWFHILCPYPGCNAQSCIVGSMVRDLNAGKYYYQADYDERLLNYHSSRHVINKIA